jgi:hypothetical protein
MDEIRTIRIFVKFWLQFSLFFSGRKFLPLECLLTWHTCAQTISIISLALSHSFLALSHSLSHTLALSERVCFHFQLRALFFFMISTVLHVQRPHSQNILRTSYDQYFGWSALLIKSRGLSEVNL